MHKTLERVRKLFSVHSPSKEWIDIYKKESSDCYRELDIPTKAVLPPNLYRSYLGLDPIIPVDKDKQIIKILEGKNAIIQFDSILPTETMKNIKENILNQLRENGFAVVDAKCKIVEIDRPPAIIETK